MLRVSGVVSGVDQFQRTNKMACYQIIILINYTQWVPVYAAADARVGFADGQA